jgi:diguanylate cyclase (GGDEF)-like protein|tara:strand:+ start:550 stop:1467 length:918 start_codon:yes stop_codon:yes gene_type:complete
MAQPTVSYNIEKKRASIVALDPRRSEKLISSRRHIRVLELSGLLSKNIELEKIVEIFSNEIISDVPHTGYQYECNQIDVSFSQGVNAGHSANYRLSIHNQPIGELTFFRTDSFTSKETCELEDLLCALIFPVKHAVMYQLAVQSAYSDSLTGLNNRTSMEKHLPREIELSNRYNHSMAILVMDLDGFKQINDSHGHDIGDQVLCEVGAVILNAVRSTDLVYRYGGDEFVGGLVQTNLEDALYVSERIRSGVEDLKMNTGLSVDNLKVSIGLTMVKSNDSLKQAFKRADKALYLAKLAGKNRIINH